MAAGSELSTPMAAASADRLRLQFWPIANVIPSARNGRSHSAAQLAEIAGSIRTFGFVNPLLVGEGGALIAGHGRLELESGRASY
jgi:hypothetical protein